MSAPRRGGLFCVMGAPFRVGRFWLVRRLGLRLFLRLLSGPRLITQAVAFARDLNDLGMVQEAVEDRRGAGYVADQFAPIFQRSVAGHHGRTGFVATHDDL